MPYSDILSREKDLLKPEYHHEILVKGSDFESCKQRVLHFFEKYQLVRYSQITILENYSLPASSPDFGDRLMRAVLKNRQIVHNLVKELQNEGVVTLYDVGEILQGYKSKMLHVITHFVDGFFGIDTFFYNLEDDTHWVTEEFQKKLYAAPSHYWILTIKAKI